MDRFERCTRSLELGFELAEGRQVRRIRHGGLLEIAEQVFDAGESSSQEIRFGRRHEVILAKLLVNC